MPLTLCGPVAYTSERPDGAPGDRVPLPVKCLALLAYLALERRPHTRELLGALLWGDSSDDLASGSLRQALKRLREAVGDDLHVERTTVALAPALGCDVRTFVALAEAGREEAIDVPIPRFLEGLTVRDAPRFEEWAEQTRGALLRRYRTSIIAAARAAQARHEWSRAIDLGDRWQSLDALSDDAAHFRVESRYLLGDRDAALAVYREFRALRRHETTKEPMLALRELAARIESAPTGPAPKRSTVTEHSTLPSFDGELIARATEWSALERAWHGAESGHARIVLLEGESGVGRSRLLEDFLRLTATNGATVLRGRAFSAGLNAPYGPLLDIVRGAIDAPGAAGTDAIWLAEVARIAPELRQHFQGLPEPSSVSATGSLLHEGVAQLLLASAEESSLVIAIDDAQWLDADSAHLLHHLVRRLENASILWCVASALGAVGRDAPAARLLRALATIPNATRLTLQPFSRDDVWRLIRSLGHVRNPEGGARLATRVHELTGGNALYIVELLKTLFARGWLNAHPETGEWMTSETGDELLHAGEMFPSVREGIGERVAALPDEEHALLLTVAAMQSGCHTSVLSYVHGISRLRAAHICDALVERHLVNEQDATYHCTHALIASVVLDSVGASRRREVHRMIALALTDAAASVRRTVDPGAVARHAEAGGEAALAHRHALLASEASASRGAQDDALAWLDVAASCAESPEERNAADVATAELLDRIGGVRDARLASSSPRLGSSPSIGRGDVDLIGRAASV